MAGIYLHIPFCRQKCHYCNFYSVASRKMMDGYIPALLKEIELQQDYTENEIIETVYFGGGTPSMLDPTDTGKILNQLKTFFKISSTAEITLEANPDDIDQEKVIQWKEMGINRLSLGVQSFQDDDLEYLYRKHNGTKARKAIETILNAGMGNLSVDLIYGIPTLTKKKWLSNLEDIVQYSIPHLSAYWLTVEDGTALQKLISRNKLALPEDDEGIEQFNILQEWAVSNGYIHYEISNLGKKGHFSMHNQNYWKGMKYLGLGPSAHSFNGNSRQWNVSSIGIYKEKILQNSLPFELEELSPVIRYEEQIMTGLRTIWGVDLEKLKRDFGQGIMGICLNLSAPYIAHGNLIIDNNFLKLSPKSYLISDHIIADLFIGDKEWLSNEANCRGVI